jgi:ribosome-associated translation inhibitor RaiA
MQVQFNSDSSIMGTENVAERIERQLRERLARFVQRMTRLEVHVRDDNARKGGADDKTCMIEARIAGEAPVSVTAHGDTVDAAARQAGSKLAKLLENHFGKADRHKHDPSPDKAV